jgi:hypothetical protein
MRAQARDSGACSPMSIGAIWIVVSAKKAQAIMASKSSKTDPVPITLEAFGRELACRREAAGPLDLPRNTGDRRTESKKALLAAIEAAGGKW